MGGTVMGVDYLSIMPKVIPLLVLLVIGYIFKRKKFLSENTILEVKNFILNITLPALLFTAFLDIDFRVEYLVIVLIVMIINLLMLYLGKKLTPFLKKEDPYLKLLFTGFEMGMLGIPLFTAIYGIDNVKYIGIIDIGHEIFIWFILVGILFKLRQAKKGADFKDLFRSFITSPVIIAILVGIILNIVGFADIKNTNMVAFSIMESIKLIAGLTVPLILIIIGYEMEFKTENIGLPLKIIAIRLVILIPLALVINFFIFSNILDLTSMYNTALITMLVMPPPFIIPLFIKEEELTSRKYIFNTLSISTVISITIFIITTFVYMG